MSDSKTNQADNQQKNDEIDLIQLFSSIGNWFKSIFVGLFNAIGSLLITILYFTLRNYIAIFIILVISIFLFFAKFSTTTYQSSMKIKANAITNQEAINYINRLNELTGEENTTELAKQLNIDTASASKIVGIEAFWSIDKDGDGVSDYIDFEDTYIKIPEDSISKRINSYFDIRLEYTENLDVALVNTSIVAYFDKNPYFVKANEIRKKQMLESYNITKIEQIKLDTTRTSYNKAIFESATLPETRNGQLVFMNGDKTNYEKIKLFHPEMFKLETKAQRLSKQLELHPNIVSILEDFTISNKPATSFFDYSRYSILFFIFSIVCVIIFENRKKIAELKKKSEIK